MLTHSSFARQHVRTAQLSTDNVSMESVANDWRDVEALGAALMRGVPLQVYRHGIVRASGVGAHAHEEVLNDEGHSTRGSAAGSGQRPAGRQGTSRGQRSRSRSGSARPGPRIGGRDLRAVYKAQIGEAQDAYPSLRWRSTGEGIWLRVLSRLLPDRERGAILLVGLPHDPSARARAWGFWDQLEGPAWIGPRHTNMPDGSICAFGPQDGVWAPGGSIVGLLDLYSTWCVRHLHLRAFGWWPGRQYAISHPHYRLSEAKGHELCPCGSVDRTYAECCQPGDAAAGEPRWLQTDFETKYGTSLADRRPPEAVTQAIVDPKSFAQKMMGVLRSA